MVERQDSGVWLTTRDERRTQPSAKATKRKRRNYTRIGSYKIEGASVARSSTNRPKFQTKISRFLLRNAGPNDGQEVDNLALSIERIHHRETCSRATKNQQLVTSKTDGGAKQEVITVLQALEQYDVERQNVEYDTGGRNATSETRQEIQNGKYSTSADGACTDMNKEAWGPHSHSTEASFVFPSDKSTSHLPFSELSDCSADSDMSLPDCYDPAFYRDCAEYNTQGETLPPITHSLIHQALGSPVGGLDCSNQIQFMT